MNKLETAKQVIKDNFQSAHLGLFDTRNIVGDPMRTVYHKDGLRIDICYSFEYFEVFGLSFDEFRELEKFYNSLEYKYDDDDDDEDFIIGA